MSEVLLSAFNPSTMSPQLLEAIFVEREPLVQELLGSIRGSLSPTSKAHSLILGPRGMGKTHLVSLIYHRIREGKKGAEGLDEHLRIAWLREEERGIATFFHLLRRILVVLSETYKDPELRTRLAALAGNSPQDTQVLAERLLVEWLDGKTLLLLVENFEDMLHRMGEQGQQAFRAFLQNRSCCLVLATAPTLTAALSKQTAPFYNFFNLHTLEEFSVETARGLMRLIAQQRGDKEFADFLETPVATERLRAIEDLAGGHPRIWILFAGFLTKEILDDLVPAFYKLVDELTPYYQSKMEMLPGQEALIIETLCEKPGAMPVKELADACFLAPNAVSAHLNDLTKRGFVRSEKLGRESYYELREPLLRIWIQVKGERDKPIKLIIEFIKRWFSLAEAERFYRDLSVFSGISKLHFEIALVEKRKDLEYADSIYGEVFRKNDAGDISGSWNSLKEVMRLRGADVESIDYYVAFCNLYKLRKYSEAMRYLDLLIISEPNNSENILRKSIFLFDLGDYDNALEYCNQSIKMNPLWFVPWSYKIGFLCRWNRLKDALECCEECMTNVSDTSDPYFEKAAVLILLGDYERGLDCVRSAYESIFDFSPESYCEIKYLISMIKNSKDKDKWVTLNSQVIEFMFSLKLMKRLGQSVVLCIEFLFNKEVINDVADAWLLAWHKAGAGYEELEIPLRMLAAAVEWKKTRSRAALLRLEPELRSKLESLLPREASVVEAPRRKR